MGMSRGNQVWAFWVFALAGVLMIAAAYLNGLGAFENLAEDSLYQGSKAVSTDIVIVGIDDDTLELMGQWPYPRSVQADVIEKIESGKPAAVGVDVIYADRSTAEEDAEMARVLGQYKNIVLPVYADFSPEGTRGGRYVVEKMNLPLKPFMEKALTGHINVLPDPADGIVRKHVMNFKAEGRDIRSFSQVIYDLYAAKTGKRPMASIGMDAFNRIPIDFTGKNGTFEKVSYALVYSGEVDPSYFKDKIVLIGPYAAGLGDFYYTPLQRQERMYGVEIHANLLQMFLDGRLKQHLPYGYSLLAVAMMTAMVAAFSSRFSMRTSALVVLALSAIYIGAAKRLYEAGWIIQLVYPVIAGLLTFLISAAYKYIAELLERKRITDIFRRYVSPQVVAEITKVDRDALSLGGIRKEVSVLFVDIRGFTPLSEKMEPEQIVEILNEYLNLTAQSIFKYGGTVDKFIGDATMALFNAPLDLEDHPMRAVRAAWAMKEGAEELEKMLLERFGRSVQFGIGITTGDAVIGNIGAVFRMDYTAIGDTVNTAARLEANAKPGQILISHATYERLKDRITVEDRGLLKVKGKDDEIQIYEVKGVEFPSLLQGGADIE